MIFIFLSRRLSPKMDVNMDKRSKIFLNSKGIHPLNHIPKKINSDIVSSSDLVLALDMHILMALNAEYSRYSEKKIKLLTFNNPNINLFDPYRFDDDKYNQIMNNIDIVIKELSTSKML